MKIDLDVKVQGASQEQIVKYKEIFSVLIQKGALDGVKAGEAIIHFDSNGVFQGVEFAYWPWRRANEDREIDNMKVIAERYGFEIVEKA